MIKNKTIGLVIPCFKVNKKILKVLNKVPKFVDYIVIVDDKCPQKSGYLALKFKSIKNLIVHFNKINLGVGASVLIGYEILLKKNCDILVKIDGDDQMQQSQMINLIRPLLNKHYDYCKGNRYLTLKDRKAIPPQRFYGNYLISIFSKITTGYWDIFDFLNGFTAIKANSAKKMLKSNIDKKFFFETDMLFKLNLLNAKVKDISVSINYLDNISNFVPRKEFKIFLFKNFDRYFLRIKRKYFNTHEFFSSFIFTNFICSIIMNFFYHPISFFNMYFSLQINIAIIFHLIFSTSLFLSLDYLNNPNRNK